MKILIIGKNSFIGKSFSSFLSKRIDIKYDSISLRDDSWKFIDFKQYDCILYLVSIVHINENKVKFNEYIKINQFLLRDVASKANIANVKKFIFVSSSAVFGNMKKIFPNSIPNPVSKYGLSKLIAENELIDIFKNSITQLTIIRPPMIYGKGAKGNPALIEHIAKYLMFFPDTKNRKSFINIDTLNDFILDAALKKQPLYLHPSDPFFMSTFELFKFYRKINNKHSIRLILLGRIIRFFLFVKIVDKIFGSQYYSIE